MTPPMCPPGEAQRLARLHRLHVLDTDAEASLDRVTRLAAGVTGRPIALVSLVDAERQWFKSAVGMEQGTQTPRDVSFCAHAICGDGLLEVPDARTDPRFCDNPFVLGDPGVVHYAGALLRMPEGEAIGTLCVIGHEPGSLSASQKALLQELADNVVAILLMRESERELRHERLLAQAQLTELAPVGMFSADAQGRVLSANRHLATIVGAADPGQLAGHGWHASVHPHDLPVLREGCRRALREGTPYCGVFRTAAPGGEPRWVELRAARASAPGTPLALAGAVVDISQLLQLERELQQKNDLLAAVIEHLPCGITVFDKDLRHLVSNRNVRRLLEVPDAVAQAPGASFASICRYLAERGEYGAGDIDAMVAERVARVRGREQDRRESRRQNGSVLEIRGNYMPDGGVITTYTDITPAKQLEAELRAALAAADQANEAKSRFLATMSHEIRTPLNGVIGLAQVLAGAALPPAESDVVGLIDSCAKSLLGLVDNILDLSRIEAGRLTLEEVPTDLLALVGEVADLFGTRAADQGLRFQLRVAPHVPRWIACDPGRVRQVLLNLLANALKFTAAGGFGLAVDVAGAGGDETLSFEVTDTGIGIAPEDQAKLFTRFTQVDASSTRRYQGSGLGLAISHELAQLMGGTLRLRSAPGEGSSFTVTLPLRRTGAPVAAGARHGPELRRDARILLAEDNEVNQLVATRLLQSLGLPDVTVVADGAQALAACRRESFDLVLMDRQMPAMDGLQATRALRAAGVRTPVVAVTASATPEDRDACLAAGMNDYLTKPIERAVLAEKLQRWLAVAPRQEASAACLAPPSPERPAFDIEAALQACGDDLGFLEHALDVFARRGVEDLDALEAAIRRGDTAAAAGLAHKLKGGAGTLGAARMAHDMRLLEEALRPPGGPAMPLLKAGRASHAAFVQAARELVAGRGTAVPAP